MKFIKLAAKRSRKNTALQYVIVDDDMYDELIKYDWSCSSNGYAQRRFVKSDGTVTTIQMQRQILGLNIGDDKCVDHINYDKLDNRRENLRICTRTENNHNIKISKRNKSGAKGVSEYHRQCKNKDGTTYQEKYWRAIICVNYNNIILGLFPYTDEGFQQAKAAYNEAAIEYYGEFAYINT